MTTMPTTTEVVTWDELSEEGKAKAKELYAWDEYYDNLALTECFKEALEGWGFPTDNVEWSLTYSQGDGMAFYGSVDLEAYVRKIKMFKHFRPLFAESSDVQAEITKNSYGHHYSHWNTMTGEVALYSGSTPRRMELCRELEERLSEDIKAVSRELESIGYMQIEQHYEDEYLGEMAEGNDWAFNPDGVIADIPLSDLLEFREENKDVKFLCANCGRDRSEDDVFGEGRPCPKCGWEAENDGEQLFKEVSA